MKHVLISGGSRGIGKALTETFCRAGDAVAFLYHTHQAEAEAVAAETGASAIRCDVSDPDDVRRAVAEAGELLGGSPDCLISNAGVSWIGQIQDMTDNEWRTVLDTNLSGAFYLTRSVVTDMIRRKYGRVIFIGSMWGKVGASCEVAYSASKAGLRGLTMALAKELGPSGITVNCVEPGVIDTDMNASLGRETLDSLCEETPLGRLGTPSDIASAVRFLVSEEASFITGQILGADGGIAL